MGKKKTGRKEVTMESRGVTKEDLEELYVIQQIPLNKIRRHLNVSEKVLNRWLKECAIHKRDYKYYFDNHFFDIIDTEEKAYWLGFVWCDGYATTRKRETSIEKPVKISLAIEDKNHLKKFKKSVLSNHPIHVYKNKSFNEKEALEARLTLSNKHFGSILQDKYGMIPHRTDASKVLGSLPENLERHFLRGVLDADGSITNYYLQSGVEKGYLKSTMSFSTHSEIIDWIQEYMIKNNLKNNIIKTSKRYGENTGGDCIDLGYSGVSQVLRIAEHLYEGATIFLDRKYEKYNELIKLSEKRELSRREVE